MTEKPAVGDLVYIFGRTNYACLVVNTDSDDTEKRYYEHWMTKINQDRRDCYVILLNDGKLDIFHVGNLTPIPSLTR